MNRRRTRRHDSLLGQPGRWFVRQLPWALVYWAALVPVAFSIRHGVYALMGDHYPHGGWLQTFLYEDIKITVLFGIFVVIQFGLLSYRALMEEKVRAGQTAASLRQAPTSCWCGCPTCCAPHWNMATASKHRWRTRSGCCAAMRN